MLLYKNEFNTVTYKIGLSCANEIGNFSLSALCGTETLLTTLNLSFHVLVCNESFNFGTFSFINLL